MRVSKVVALGLFVALIIPTTLLCSGCGGVTDSKKCGPPMVSAGDDLTGSVGEPVILAGSLRLPDETEQVCISEKSWVTYRWEQLSGPDVTLDNEKAQQAMFIPSQAGSYSFRCQATYPVTEVNPTTQVSQWDTVSVTVEAVACESPVADAGADQELATLAGTPVTVTMSGANSHPDTSAGCLDVTISGFSWSVVSEPAGSSVTINSADQAEATVEISEFGVYEFQLQVQDSGGTEEGRLDTDSDILQVTLLETSPCEDSLVVTVIAGSSGAAQANFHVVVVDADSASHTLDTAANGQASFSGLAIGTRQSITVYSDEKVTALEGAPDAERPRWETTSVIEHCSGEITIPVHLSDSGIKSAETGLIVGKVPAHLFDMLPHSFQCAGDCSIDTDCTSPETYYCEQEANVCQGLCTPRSLLPFFSLGDPNISGQMRVAILVPVFELGNFNQFSVGRMFARPPTDDAILPGNLASDDTFLNGLSSALGLDPYGDPCESISECPNDVDWICDYDAGKCKDKTPLRNIRMEVPAGNNIRLLLLTGVMNVSMLDLLPVLLPFLEPDGGELSFDVGSMLAAFKLRTLHACPISLNVSAGQENDIAATLAALTKDDCWNITYQQKEDTLPLADPSAIDPGNTCTADAECDANNPGYKCLPNPDDPDSTYCFLPMHQVTILSNDETSLVPAASGFVPSDGDADARMCGLLPATAQHEVKCEGSSGLPESCDPKVTCDIPITSADTECAFSFGLALAALDFPIGHATFPEGGRAVVGFNFNRTPFAYDGEPKFLIPSLDVPVLNGASIAMTQLFLRNIVAGADLSYELMPGKIGVWAASSSNVASLNLPGFLSPPAPSGLPEAGLEISVSFIAEDPYAGCGSVVFDKIYAIAKGLLAPQSGSHDFPASTSESDMQNDALLGLSLQRVDRIIVDEKEQVLSDSLWRIYAPSGTTSITLPSGAGNPFSSGNQVRLSFWGSDFATPFDFNLFPTNMILYGQISEASDGWDLVVP